MDNDLEHDQSSPVDILKQKTYRYAYCQAPLPAPVTPPHPKATLRHVTIIARHGDRTPSLEASHIVYENNIKTPITFNCDYTLTKGRKTPCTQTMQLTRRGFKQHVLLGKAFREQYKDVMFSDSDTIPPEQVYARSTRTSRTMLSLDGFERGLFQIPLNRSTHVPVKNSIIEKQQHEPMVGIHTTKADKLAEKVMASAAFQQYVQDKRITLPARQKLAHLLKQKFNIDPKQFDNHVLVAMMADVPRTVACHPPKEDIEDMELKTKEEEKMLDALNLAEASLQSFHQSVYYGHEASLDWVKEEYGTLFGEIRDAMVNASRGLTKERMRILLGHDDTLAALLGGLGAQHFGIPYVSSRPNHMIMSI